MKVLVTGMAGFIGYHIALKLAEDGHNVYGIDNINDYYNVQLKYDRLNDLGINQETSSVELKECHSNKFENLKFKKVDLTNDIEINNLFDLEKFDKVCHLAAQAGVRYSIENPKAYIDSNITGFLNILECCKNYNVKHLVYASSSSVYGNNKKTPFGEQDVVDSPISLYASTKISNELMAYTYNHLYGLTTTGLRFFTVYGPYDRPDMALQKFARAIMNDDPISVFNFGKHRRDFTYIDDIIEGVVKVLDRPATSNLEWVSESPDSSSSSAPYRIYNIGINNPVELLDYIKCLEKSLGKVAEKEMLPMQPGDVRDTYADVDSLVEDFDYKPSMSIDDGISSFCNWYLDFYS